MSHGAQFGAALALTCALSGCKSERPSPQSAAASNPAGQASSPAPAAVTVTARDYAFDAPAQIAAGAVTFQLQNHGKEVHQAMVAKLDKGKTGEDLVAAMKQHGPQPAWMKWVGGPNAVAPGGQVDATSVLEPGHYAYLCVVPSPDGVIHLAKGMVRTFEVTAAPSGTANSLPEADLTIRLKDYGFESSQPLGPGKHRIMVENAGPQGHELVLVKLAPGKSAADFASWAMSMKGPPPAMPVGGVGVLENGMRASFTVDLPAGDYGLICFIPDTKDGKPHYAHGMVKTIKVG